MGFWKRTVDVFQDVTSLGGTARLRGANRRYRTLAVAYQSLIDQISSCNAELNSIVCRVRKRIAISSRRLKRAHKLLFPLGNRNLRPSRVHASGRKSTLQTSPDVLVKSSTSLGIEEYSSTIAGVAAGTAATGASWAAVQVAGHASTGAAMAGLHGAAASNAAWAWFGGGSLAAGGSGMALGHIMLPGIGTAVAITVSASLAHTKANKLVKACKEIEGINHKNALVLKKVNSDIETTQTLENKLTYWDGYLSEEVKTAQSKLFRFGFMSRLWRLLRFFFCGCYYTTSEFAILEQLGKAVERFISEFQTKVS